MTTDVVHEPTTVQQPEGAETTEEPEIVIPKGMKIKKMPKPDKTGHEMQVTRLKQKIDEQYTRINEIKEAIDLKKSSKDGIAGQAQGNREKLNKLQADFKTTLEEKKAVQARIQGLRDLQKQMRDESKQLRETVQGSYFKVEDMTRRLRASRPASPTRAST
jgi:chromosome segregation ATPase